MVSTLALVRLLAVLPATVLAAIADRNGKGFDPSDLTYREVGARNTIVSPRPHNLRAMLIPLGLARLAREGRPPHFLLARHSPLPRSQRHEHHPLLHRDLSLDRWQARDEARRASQYDRQVIAMLYADARRPHLPRREERRAPLCVQCVPAQDVSGILQLLDLS